MNFSDLFVTYLGCYKDNSTRQLPNSCGSSSDNQAQTCARCCYNANPKYVYSGTQYSDQCFCGETYGGYPKLPESSCDMACSGNPSQMCGGFWTMNIYGLFGSWSEWSAWSDCKQVISFYTDATLSSLAKLSFELDCGLLMNGTEQSDYMVQTILDRLNKTQVEIGQIESRKQEALVRLQEQYKTTDTIADCGGMATAIFVGLLMFCLVFCDLLKLLTYFDVFKRGQKGHESLRDPKRTSLVYKNSPEDILYISARRTVSSSELRNLKQSSAKAKDGGDPLVSLAAILEATLTPRKSTADFNSPSSASFSSRGSLNSRLSLTNIEII